MSRPFPLKLIRGIASIPRMTDQDRVTRFPNGEPIHPLPKTRPISTITGAILGWAGLAGFIIVTIYLTLALLSARAAHGDEATVIFDQPGECSINTNLRVTGTKRASCIEHLSTALRLARAEMLVNEHRRK